MVPRWGSFFKSAQLERRLSQKMLFFPTCQVRVVRFYQGCSPCLYMFSDCSRCSELGGPDAVRQPIWLRSWRTFHKRRRREWSLSPGHTPDSRATPTSWAEPCATLDWCHPSFLLRRRSMPTWNDSSDLVWSGTVCSAHSNGTPRGSCALCGNRNRMGRSWSPTRQMGSTHWRQRGR